MDKQTDSKLITKKGIILKEKQKAFFPLPSPKLSDTAKVTSPYSPSIRLLSDKKLSRKQAAIRQVEAASKQKRPKKLKNPTH